MTNLLRCFGNYPPSFLSFIPDRTWRFHAWKKAGLVLLLLSLLAGGNIHAQTGTKTDDQTITGKVTDAATKETLPGVTVSIPSLKIGAITDRNGVYTIRHVPIGRHAVQAKMLGYQIVTQTANVAAGENVTLNFALGQRALQQNEIVVTGLSGEIDRRKLGNAVGNVNGTDIAQAVTPVAIDAIAGRVPGVYVKKPSGTPGAGTYITIRGRKTILGSSEPLYVVDGIVIDNTSVMDKNWQSGEVQLGNRATDINAQDIESIEILKGASAAALYGSLAANGVVLITTKRPQIGTSEKPATVTYSGSLEANERVSSYPLQRVYGQIPNRNLTYGAKLPADTQTFDQSAIPFRTGTSHEQTISVTGGAPQFNYLASGTLSQIEGTVKNSDLDRVNLRLNLNAQLLSKLDIQSNSNFITTENNLPQDGSNTSGIMLGALRTPPEFKNEIITNPDGSQHQFFGSYDNPLWTQANNKFKTSLDRFLHTTGANWDPLEWLHITGRIGLDKYQQSNIERLAVGSSNSGGLGEITHSVFTSSSLNTDLAATIAYSPTEEIATTLMIGGQSIWANRQSNITSSSQTLPFFDEIPAGANKDANSSSSASKTVGQYVQLTASWRDRLTLTGAVRRDGSSTFGTSNKFHYFPKVSFAYTISDEDFMQSLKGTVDNLKLRGSYGEAGSPSLPGAYATNSLYSTFGNNDPWGRNTTAGRGGFGGIRQGGGDDLALFQAGATDISPEISIEREIGLDVGLFDNRISMEYSFYRANIYDLILSTPVPGSSGYDRQLKNAGAMWNEGFEFTLGAIPIKSEDFTWSTAFNWSRNYNLVTRLGVKLGGDNVYGSDDALGIFGFTGTENVALVGHPLGVFRSTGYKRDASGKIMVSTGEADNSFGFDHIGAPIIDFDSTHIIGDPNPDFSISWRNDLTLFRDLSIGFLFDGVFGQDVWNGTRGALYRFGTHANTADRDEPWIWEGKPVVDGQGKPVTREQYYRYYANSFSYGIDEAQLEDGSYLKLREISVSYNWHGLRDWNIETVGVSFAARNLITWTDYSGFDPEVNTFAQSEAQGFDYFNLPQTRSYRFGISLTY